MLKIPLCSKCPNSLPFLLIVLRTLLSQSGIARAASTAWLPDSWIYGDSSCLPPATRSDLNEEKKYRAVVTSNFRQHRLQPTGNVPRLDKQNQRRRWHWWLPGGMRLTEGWSGCRTHSATIPSREYRRLSQEYICTVGGLNVKYHKTMPIVW